jgi:hypothetical protein
MKSKLETKPFLKTGSVLKQVGKLEVRDAMSLTLS